jgi:hypothetical protein
MNTATATPQPYVDCRCDSCDVVFPVITSKAPAVYEDCTCPTCDGRQGSSHDTQQATREESDIYLTPGIDCPACAGTLDGWIDPRDALCVACGHNYA